MERQLKIVLDSNIPFIADSLAEIGGVVALPADEITPEVMADADILVCRTRTRCNAGLLDDSRCRFIGTATIGTDHIDLDYCRRRGITVANAPGCNAPAVAQWVLAAIRSILPVGKPLSSVTLGVIGAGHVGSILIRWAEGLGMRVLVNDPPLQESAPDAYTYSSLDEIARECDAITVHTPLTRDGAHPTFHLIDKAFVDSLQRKPIVMNAARGPVTDTRALVDGFRQGKISALAIDCWEGEPSIDPTLLEIATVATPHIAGYSLQGKIRASQMILDALDANCRDAACRVSNDATQCTDAACRVSNDASQCTDAACRVSESAIGYPTIMDETAALKSRPDLFEHMRNNYSFREEPSKAGL